MCSIVVFGDAQDREKHVKAIVPQGFSKNRTFNHLFQEGKNPVRLDGIFAFLELTAFASGKGRPRREAPGVYST